MEKYIHLFNTQAEFEAAYNGSEYKEPWLSYVEGKGIDYNKYDPFNGHDYVDLGLPSGKLWATCNVGANSPEEYGGYYAWGETQTKSNYAWSTYLYGTSGNISKYNSTDNKTGLDLEDDAVRAIMGGAWRMPTETEFSELISGTTLTKETINNIGVIRLVSKTNGNSIIIPIAGLYSGENKSGVNSYSYIWSSSLDKSNSSQAKLFFFMPNTAYMGNYFRYYGTPLRGVIG